MRHKQFNTSYLTTKDVRNRSFYPKNQTDWREWLLKNHASQQSVWLLFYTKKSQKPSLSWGEAVDVALCFGWIDSKKIKINEEQSHQFFSKRKPKSTWSKINKEKTKQLINDGLMTQAGLDSIKIAKLNGSWTILDEVEDLIIPADLEKKFEANASAKDIFLSLSKSKRKMILHQLLFAKRTETRNKRLGHIIEQLIHNNKEN